MGLSGIASFLSNTVVAIQPQRKSANVRTVNVTVREEESASQILADLYGIRDPKVAEALAGQVANYPPNAEAFGTTEGGEKDPAVLFADARLTLPEKTTDASGKEYTADTNRLARLRGMRAIRRFEPILRGSTSRILHR